MGKIPKFGKNFPSRTRPLLWLFAGGARRKPKKRDDPSHVVLTFERGISAAIGYQGEEEGFEPLLGEPTSSAAGSIPAVQSSVSPDESSAALRGHREDPVSESILPASGSPCDCTQACRGAEGEPSKVDVCISACSAPIRLPSSSFARGCSERLLREASRGCSAEGEKEMLSNAATSV